MGMNIGSAVIPVPEADTRQVTELTALPENAATSIYNLLFTDTRSEESKKDEQ